MPTTKPFRIDKRLVVIRVETDEQQSNVSFYLEKLIKLIPTEIIGLYLTLHSIGNSPDAQKTDSYFTFISIASLLLLVFVRIWGTNSGSWRTAQWSSVAISSVSFIIWIYAMGHAFAGVEFDNYRIISALVVIWTFGVPYLYKKD